MGWPRDVQSTWQIRFFPCPILHRRPSFKESIPRKRLNTLPHGLCLGVCFPQTPALKSTPSSFLPQTSACRECGRHRHSSPWPVASRLCRLVAAHPWPRGSPAPPFGATHLISPVRCAHPSLGLGDTISLECRFSHSEAMVSTAGATASLVMMHLAFEDCSL